MKVTFYSPGTFVPEENVVETTLTDPYQIAELARDIVQRYGARPFCFKIEGEKRMHWLGGTIKTIDDIPDTKENYILRWNMINNNITRVIENNNSYKHTSPFGEDDVLLDWKV